MSTYIILGTYSNKGARGLVEGESDRRAAMEILTNSAGAKLLDYHITRGIYDFCVIAEAENFDMVAAMNLKAKAADTVGKLDVLESLNIDEIRNYAKKVTFLSPTEK